jgi:hypothetical protein
MTKQSTKIVVRDVVGSVPYWAMGDTLPLAKKNFKKYSGRFPSKNASIIALTGDNQYIDTITVHDLGDVIYNQNLSLVKIQ